DELASQVPDTSLSGDIGSDVSDNESKTEVALEGAEHTSALELKVTVSDEKSDTKVTESRVGTQEAKNSTLSTTKPTVKESEKATTTQKTETTKANNAAYLGKVHLYIDAKNALPHISGKGYTYVPSNGIIFDGEADLYEGDSVALILKRELDKRSIPYKLEQRNNYLSSLADLKEKDKNCGPMSGWYYYVNGVSPGIGIGSYKQNMKPNPALSLYPLKPGDRIDFYYTVNQKDVPGRS
ncbi:MAG TPA: DUF4430 domain-containing protein, partial [Clostridiales bacterium]|nr:DUF4430 domain-containing protein [Clostridiales bacterium]